MKAINLYEEMTSEGYVIRMRRSLTDEENPNSEGDFDADADVEDGIGFTVKSDIPEYMDCDAREATSNKIIDYVWSLLSDEKKVLLYGAG